MTASPERAGGVQQQWVLSVICVLQVALRACVPWRCKVHSKSLGTGRYVNPESSSCWVKRYWQRNTVHAASRQCKARPRPQLLGSVMALLSTQGTPCCCLGWASLSLCTKHCLTVGQSSSSLHVVALARNFQQQSTFCCLVLLSGAQASASTWLVRLQTQLKVTAPGGHTKHHKGGAYANSELNK